MVVPMKGERDRAIGESLDEVAVHAQRLDERNVRSREGPPQR
jgi:hypothetical protein